MAIIVPTNPIAAIHGKINKKAKGYHYQTSDGKTHYRERMETYQKNQSPKQLWNSQSFAYAHAQLPAYCTEETLPATEMAWRQATKIDVNAKKYANAKRWKFADLQREWRAAHPFEQWYAEHMDQLSAALTAKTNAANISDYAIKSKMKELQTQIKELERLLKH